MRQPLFGMRQAFLVKGRLCGFEADFVGIE